MPDYGKCQKEAEAGKVATMMLDASRRGSKRLRYVGDDSEEEAERHEYKEGIEMKEVLEGQVLGANKRRKVTWLWKGVNNKGGE